MTQFSLPRLERGDVHVWWSELGALPEGHEALLDEGELERRASLRRRIDRSRFTLGCVLVRVAAGAYLGAHPREVPLDRRCPDCGKLHGKPRLSRQGDLEFSVSHSGDRVVVAVGRDSPVGVDVEDIGAFEETSALEAMILSSPEASRFRTVGAGQRTTSLLSYWTQKEAILKATGDGLRVAPSSLVVSGPDGEPRLLEWRRGPVDPSEVRLHRLDPGPGYLAHLAVIGRAAGSVLQLDASELLGSAPA